jgi:hypothetical protein
MDKVARDVLGEAHRLLPMGVLWCSFGQMRRREELMAVTLHRCWKLA